MSTASALFSPICNDRAVSRNDAASPLKTWRERRGLALGDISRETGFGAEWLAKVEAGHRSMTDDQRKIVALALGVHPVELDHSFFANFRMIAEAAWSK